MPIRPELFFQSTAALTAYAITFTALGLDLLEQHGHTRPHIQQPIQQQQPIVGK